MRLHATTVVTYRWKQCHETLADCFDCGWFGRFFDYLDAIRFAQRHRALTAQEEAGQAR